MKILVTGGKGQLGHDVVNRLEHIGIECKGVDIDDFDLTCEEQVLSYISDYMPDAIIHCAAYTYVDRAEEEKEACKSVNVDGTANIKKAAENLGAKLMYISTDYVFDGEGTRFFQPDDQANPINWYGKTKLEGEKILLDYPKHFIVRISWVFGANGNNFIKTMLRLAQTKDEINVVADQIGSPTFTYDLAVLLCDMIQTEKYGTYHATNEGECSWAEFAEYIFACAGKAAAVNRIGTEDYPTRAARPGNSRLDKSTLEAAGFERLPDWKDAVRRYVEELMK